MDNHLLKTNDTTPQLRVVQDADQAPIAEEPVNLEEERKKLEEQAETEDFWAGRNLAGRNSAQGGIITRQWCHGPKQAADKATFKSKMNLVLRLC